MQPDPLPNELPIGTKVKVGETTYIALSVGKLQTGTFMSDHYSFVLVESLNGTYKGTGTFYHDKIVWVEKTEVNLIINCKWCNKVIDNGMLLCSSHESNCELYYTALKERLKLDFRKPEDALEYDRACVIKFIDNKKENNA